jgi:hypothetical protein
LQDTLAHFVPGEPRLRIGLELSEPSVQVGFQIVRHRDRLRDSRDAIPNNLNEPHTFGDGELQDLGDGKRLHAGEDTTTPPSPSRLFATRRIRGARVCIADAIFFSRMGYI